jgi:pilus assembly protein FimV
VQEVLIRLSTTALVCALAAIAPPARAAVLGEAEVRSALGEILDVRIPVAAPEGEVVDTTCFSLVHEPEPGIPVLTDGVMTVERPGGALVLRVKSVAPVTEPALLLRVRSACAGETGEALRQYALLLDPRPGYAGLASLPAVAATLDARPGDTLQSIAAKVIPQGRRARARYLAALRALNPGVAGLGDREPLPKGTAIALPDLRTYARMPRTMTAAAPRAAERPAPPSSAAVSPKLPLERKRPAPAPAPAAAEASPGVDSPAPLPAKTKPRPAVAGAAPSRASPGFALKLSNAEVDLSRSRTIDDRTRSQLRERLMVLDSDDQVAEVLSMRHSLKQLEAKVAELQLKLAAMPPSLAARSESPAPAGPAAAPKPAETPKPAPAPVAPPPVVAAAPVVAAKPAVTIAPPPAVTTPAPAPKAPEPVAKPPEPVAKLPEPVAKVPDIPPDALPAPTPGTSPPAVTAESPAGKTEAAPSPAPKATPRAPGAGGNGLSDWLWGLVALLVALALLLAFRVWHRRSSAEELEEEWIPATDFPAEPSPEDAIFEEGPVEIAEPPRQSMTSDADLTTRLPENSSDLRRRYIEERFPEILNRTIVLEDSSSVVKGGRLFYEDGALPRAVELLQFAIEHNPGEVKTWLALFEIFRLERLSGEFAELAKRFREHHGDSDYWRKVQYFGREIDPGNALYKEEAVNTLETIGPSEARRLAAANATFDPIAENWLNAPMDFQNEVLANELRKALMADAALGEQDLVPNPMPALRNVEMFTVA